MTGAPSRASWSPFTAAAGTRRDSVYNGLIAAMAAVDADDWMLVHDAARPCLPNRDLQSLIRETEADEVGGILALPVAETVKAVAKTRPGYSVSTVPRIAPSSGSRRRRRCFAPGCLRRRSSERKRPGDRRGRRDRANGTQAAPGRGQPGEPEGDLPEDLADRSSYPGEAPGEVTFRFSRLPATRRGLSPICSIAPASSVTGPFARWSACASSPARNICGVCASQSWAAILGTVDTLYPGLVFANGFYGFRHRQRQDPSDLVGFGFPDQALQVPVRKARPRRVVHQHPVVGIDRSHGGDQAVVDRVAPRPPAAVKGLQLAREGAPVMAGECLVFRGEHHEDVLDRRHADCAHRVPEHRLAGQRRVLLGPLAGEAALPLPAAGSRRTEASQSSCKFRTI